MIVFFFFKQKTAYEMRISDWSSDVCSSDLPQDARRAEDAALVVDHEAQAVAEAELAHLRGEDVRRRQHVGQRAGGILDRVDVEEHGEIGRAACRERVCQYG